MPTHSRIVLPGPTAHSVRTANGQILHPPPDWTLVPPGDPALTRRVKTAGPTWAVQEQVGRKLFSRGLWAPASAVESIRRALAAERSTPQYEKKRRAAALRRDREQFDYVQSFCKAVLQYLNFSPTHADLAHRLARAVTAHATPVGSGTVARTQRIPVERRAESAVIAWLRHQTTAYDQMPIPRIKGKRREVRRLLAAQSNRLLEAYRAGRPVNPAACPLARACPRLTPPAPPALARALTSGSDPR